MNFTSSQTQPVSAVEGSSSPLAAEETARYARQIRLPQVGVEGQLRLKAASVLIVGAGGLGSPAAMYLAAAGVGRIGVADGDRVEVSNLHRQLLHRQSDVGMAKVDSARATLEAINPHVRIETIAARISRENALDVVASYDVVIDATDNFPTRYLLNDACVITSRPLVYGSVDRFEGQVCVFAPSNGPCYRCLFPHPPEPGMILNCAEAGVLGVLPGLVGTLQAAEAVKTILGQGEALIGRLLLVDTLAMRFREVTVEADPSCPACGTKRMDHLMDYDAFCAGSQERLLGEPMLGEITPTELANSLRGGDPLVLIDVREPFEWHIGRIPTARLVPLRDFMSSDQDFGHGADIVVYCHHGARSEAAGNALIMRGYRRVRNLVGGIDRWSTDVDPTVPRY